MILLLLIVSIIAGVGSSKSTNSKTAIEEACLAAVAPLGYHQPSFFILLASPTTFNQQELLNILYAKYPSSTIVGCSTSGEITSDGPSDNSIALMAIYSDQVKFVSGIGEDIKVDARLSGQKFAEEIRDKNEGRIPQTALVFADGLAGNGADVVRGVLDVFGTHFAFAGGSAGDDFLFKQTWQYYNNRLLSGSTVGAGLYGNFTWGIGVRHGWIPIGTSRKVTKSKSNIIYELDGAPAIQIYEDQFGKDKIPVSATEPLAKLAITYPLGIVLTGQSEYLVRDPITVDSQGAITCAAEVPEGSEVYIMIGSTEEAITAAQSAARSALEQLAGRPAKLAILFNCIARKKLLMGKKTEEIEAIKNVIGPQVPLIGFYTYGEHAPLRGQVVTCSFHNETDVLFLLAE